MTTFTEHEFVTIPAVVDHRSLLERVEARRAADKAAGVVYGRVDVAHLARIYARSRRRPFFLAARCAGTTRMPADTTATNGDAR